MKLECHFEFGFVCQREKCKEINSIDLVQLEYPLCPEKMYCKSCGYVPLTYDQLMWFILSKVLKTVQETVSFICLTVH